jgi:2-polyprenyl-3-methyl-5-hydroxy-6-metoxy-1,4-benzoquinol methylase
LDEQELKTTTMAGLHDYVASEVLPRFVKTGERAIDLGAGSGLMAMRMQKLGWNVTGADLNAAGFKAPLPFLSIDLNNREFSQALGEHQYSMVTAIEVIEHVEAPISLLRNGGRLLQPGGYMVLTTPNVDSVPARLKFLLTEKIRMMDEVSEPTHISPIFWDLFSAAILPLAGMKIHEHHLVPPDGFIATRGRYAWVHQRRLLDRFRSLQFGDNHVFVLKANEA